MSEFFRFPHTAHLAWLGKDRPRGDKVLSPAEAEALLARPVTVEEKVDGANVGISIDENGEMLAQNRGSFLSRESSHPQFKPLFRWLDQHRSALEAALVPDLMLFGEWCYAVHSVAYDRLPDWFLAFDVYDRATDRFWSVPRRDELVRRLGLALIPRVATGRFDLGGLQRLFRKSQLADCPAEGLYIRADEGDHLVARAKLVRAEFTQAIDEHWSKRAMRTNALAARA
jgi:hypothetical protein